MYLELAVVMLNTLSVTNWTVLGAVSVRAPGGSTLIADFHVFLCCCTAGAGALVVKEDNPCNPNAASH